MKRINYLTTNTLKFKVAKNFFDSLNDYELIQHTFETPEIQDESSEKVAKQAAVFAAYNIGEPCIKLDASFCINSLNGFPGPFVKHINEWLSEEDFLAMLDSKTDRSAYFLDAIAIGFPDGSSKVFTKKYEGKIALPGQYEKSKWPVNSLFIPEGYSIPLGSMTTAEQESYWSNGAWQLVIEYFENSQI